MCVSGPALAAVSIGKYSGQPEPFTPDFVATDEGATVGERAAASCGGESFSPDTKVVMADGTAKPLDRVEVGDKVEATVLQTGKTTVQTVTTLWVNHDSDLMGVTVKAGGKTSVIHATQNHLFWEQTKRAWVEADQLVAGEALRADDGTADMWDLTVANDHDFYIVTATANVLVHNCPTNFSQAGKQ